MHGPAVVDRIRRSFLALIFAAAALAAAAPASHAFEQPLSGRLTPEFMHFFDTLALTADYGPFNNRPPWARKWAAPVRVFLDGPAEKLRGQVEDVLQRFSVWTGLPFTLMPPGATAAPGSPDTIRVKLFPRPAFKRLYRTRDVVCQTETRGIGGTLQVGYIAVSEGYTDCLRHEFMHALGFDSHWCPNHPTEIHSVLALRDSAARSDDYSPWDILAIRVLYDWRIRAGMNRQKSLTIAYEVIQQHPQSASLPVGTAVTAASR
jgi:hypothetical protein